MLVRHGETHQNVLLSNREDDPVFVAKLTYMDETSDLTFWWDELAGIFEEPALNSLGEVQANRSRLYAGALAKDVGEGGKVCIFVSPHLRTCQTAKPLVEELNKTSSCQTLVKDNIWETPGIPKLNPVKSADGKFRPVPAEHTDEAGLTPNQIAKDFGYDVSSMWQARSRADKGWFSGEKETHQEGRDRARKVAEWLQSEELYNECAEKAPAGQPWAVLVTHGAFINLLLQELLGIPVEASVQFDTANTAVSHLMIDLQSKTRVRVRSIGQVEHLLTVPHSFSEGAVPVGCAETVSGEWNNWGVNSSTELPPTTNGVLHGGYGHVAPDDEQE